MPDYSTPRSSVYKAIKPEFAILDIPHTSAGVEEALGVYVITRVAGHTPTPSALLYISRDGGTTYHEAMVIDKHATTGVLNKAGALGLNNADGASLAVGRDTVSTPSIFWDDSYAPQSVSENELLNGENTIMVGDEILQFKTAVAMGNGVYAHSELLRGRRGTEPNILGLQDKNMAVVLNGLPFLPLRHSDVGKQLYFKCVTSGMSLDDSNVFSLQFQGNSLKPFAPSNITGTRNASQDVTISWNRRSRSIVRLMGVKRLPYGEDSGDYEIDILTPTIPHTVLRTIKADGATSATYTASQQTADGLTLGDALFFRVYQMSDAVGRGQTNTVKLLAGSTPNFKQKSVHVTT